MNEDLGHMLAERLQAATHPVEVYLALQALAREATPVAVGAIAAFIRSAPANRLPLARDALLGVAERAPAGLVQATQDDDEKVADAARHALMARPCDAALPLYLRMARSRNVDEASAGLVQLGRISSPDARAPLFKALGHRSATVRASAAESIRSRADDLWVAQLLQAIATLRREEADKKKDWGEVIGTLCSAVVQASTEANLGLLIEGLGHEDARIRRTCIGALGRLGNAAAVDPLIETLEHPRRGMPLELRRELVEVLGQLGDARAVAPLLRAGVELAAPALGRLKAWHAVPELVAALERAKPPRDASDLAQVLAELEGPGDTQWPRLGLRSQALPVRRAAALQLAQTAPEEAVPHLRALLPDVGSGGAVGVGEALASIGCADGFDAFAQALADDPHHWNASAVASACGNLRGPRVQALLLDLLLAIRNDYVHIVCQALAAQGADVLPALIGAAQAAEAGVRHRYVVALAEFRDPRGAPLLAALLSPRNPLRDAAMLSLSATPSAEAGAALADALRRAESPAEAALLTRTLAKAATREAMPDLLRALQSEGAAHDVFEALGRLGRPGDSAALSALIEQLSSPHARRREGVATALGRIGDPAAGRPLLDMLLKEQHLDGARAALHAWRSVGMADGGLFDGGHGGPDGPGLRAVLLVSARRSAGER